MKLFWLFHISAHKQQGHYGIPHKMIAKSLPTLGLFLIKFYNNSLLYGIFPYAWKKSFLVAIKKTASLTSTSDFRPVALLCFSSKVLEKLSLDQITALLNSRQIPRKILHSLQTGFTRFSSAETTLLRLTDDIIRGIYK